MPRKFFLSLLIQSLLLLSGWFVMEPISPTNNPVPGRDAGVYLYLGQSILDGEIPYRDVWDHKPPGIHLINAAGLFLTGGSAWGVWWLQYAAVAGAALIGFALLKEICGCALAGVMSLIWLIGLKAVIETGNLTELYALPFQFSALWLIWKALGKEKPGSLLLLAIGLSGGCSFLLRQNLVGIWISVAVFFTLIAVVNRDFKQWLVSGVTMFAGCFIPITLSVAWCALNGALGQFIDCVFLYNAAYSETTAILRIKSMFRAIILLSPMALAALSFAGWTAAACRVAHAGVRSREGGFAILCLVSLPVDLLLACWSGRFYDHYYITLLPSAAACGGLFLSLLNNGVRPTKTESSSLVLGTASGVGFLIPTLCFAITFNPKDRSPGNPEIAQAIAAEHYIGEHSTPSDTVLVWGAEPGINFLAKRKSPTRYFYQYALFSKGYQKPAMMDEFVNELEKKRPRLIIDTSSTNGVFPALCPERRLLHVWGDPAYATMPEISRFFGYLDANYKLKTTLPPCGWPVWELSDQARSASSR